MYVFNCLVDSYESARRRSVIEHNNNTNDDESHRDDVEQWIPAKIRKQILIEQVKKHTIQKPKESTSNIIEDLIEPTPATPPPDMGPLAPISLLGIDPLLTPDIPPNNYLVHLKDELPF